MTREEIKNTTPEDLAAKYTASELLSRMNDFAPEGFEDYLGNVSYTMFSGEIIDDDGIDECENLLREWFDDNEKERPIDAEDLAIAYHLWAASCFAEEKEN